jgi:hypothetical protein
MKTAHVASGQTTSTTSDTHFVDFDNQSRSLTAVAVFKITATVLTMDLQGSPDGGTTWASIVKKTQADMSSGTAAFTIALMPNLRVVTTNASSASVGDVFVVHE